jgi:hypothetical protein
MRGPLVLRHMHVHKRWATKRLRESRHTRLYLLVVGRYLFAMFLYRYIPSVEVTMAHVYVGSNGQRAIAFDVDRSGGSYTNPEHVVCLNGVISKMVVGLQDE